MAKRDIHVSRGGKLGGWKIEVEGSPRPRGRFDTQREAWEAAKEMARRSEVEALLHGRNGKIRQRNTYGKDPRRTKG